MHKQASGSRPTGIVLIGASTGGPPVINTILCQCTEDFLLPIVIIQHMPPKFTRPLAEGLNESARITVKEAEDKETLQLGTAYIAPGGKHLLLDLDDNMEARSRLLGERLDFPFMPSIDLAAISAASVFGGRVIIVLLSGMSAGQDGLQGTRVVKEVGGRLLVQKPDTCIVPGIPKTVISEGLADEILSPEKIFPALLDCVKRQYAII